MPEPLERKPSDKQPPEAPDHGRTAEDPRENSRVQKLRCEEMVDEALKQSFPASDPPAYTPGHP